MLSRTYAVVFASEIMHASGIAVYRRRIPVAFLLRGFVKEPRE